MKEFKLYRTQVLFIGLTQKEMMIVESGASRYGVFYKDTFRSVSKPDAFDIICMTDSEVERYQDELQKITVPLIVIGSKKFPGMKGLIQRPIFVSDCLQALNAVAPAVKEPVLEQIKVGLIVKSKTTPMYGKGIITKILNDSEVIVRFPKSSFLIAGKESLRCHKSQLQILGYVDNLN